MVYATYSKGFRPGGVNRTEAAGIGPYQADYLTNYEIGWKTQWFDHQAALERRAVLGRLEELPVLVPRAQQPDHHHNGGNARIKGIENELEWAATKRFHPEQQLHIRWIRGSPELLRPGRA